MNEATVETTPGTPVGKPAARAIVSFDEETQKLFNIVAEANVNLKKVAKAKEVLTDRRNRSVKEIFDRHGKGPYLTPEGEQIIVPNGETYYFKSAYRKTGPDSGTTEGST